MGEIAWNGREWVEIKGRFIPVDAPEKKPEPAKAEETKPRCWVTQHLVYIRYVNPGSMQPPFGTSPQYWGSLAECRQQAKELACQLNLSIFEIGEINPNLQSKDFESAGIYIVTEKFDQFNDPGHRVFRY